MFSSNLHSYKIAAVFFALILTISACNYSEEFETINVDNKFTIDIPGFMKETDGLRDDAIFQYANRYRSFYVIAFENDKEGKTLEEYNEPAIDIFSTYLENSVVSESISGNVDGDYSIETHLYGDVPDGEESTVTVYYFHKTIETEDKFYEVCTWTRGTSRYDTHAESMQEIINSFKPL